MSDDKVPHESSFQARLMAICHAAHDINIYEFAREDGLALAEAEPGAHIDVALPNGLIRSYSLIAPGPAPERYIIAVKRDASSRGGSCFLHDTTKVGQAMTVTGPVLTAAEQAANRTVLICYAGSKTERLVLDL